MKHKHREPYNMKIKQLILVALLGLFVGGCTTVGAIGTVIDVAAGPVLGFAVKDANTTLEWVDREETAGRLTEVSATSAKLCPLSVLALDDLRSKLKVRLDDPEGTKGFIYYSTVKKYSQGTQANISLQFQQLAMHCIRLMPDRRLLSLF